MVGLAAECESIRKGEGLKSFAREASPNPFVDPRVLYMFEHLDKEINAIRNRMNRGEITGDEMMKLLIEETDACVPPEEEEEEDMEEDEGSDEDGEMEEDEALGDKEKPAIMKRPQSSPVESELESKKPRIQEGFGCRGGDPKAAEM